MHRIIPEHHKVANIFIYFAERIQPLSVNKAIKLVYLTDECAVRKTGAPISWLSYTAELEGPMPVYPVADQVSKLPITPFDDGEFSDCEIRTLQHVFDQYQHYSDEELIDVLYKENTLWHRTGSDSGLLIDFTDLLDTDYKKAVFKMAYEF